MGLAEEEKEGLRGKFSYREELNNFISHRGLAESQEVPRSGLRK
jgi:hypothetical protein